MEETVSTSTPAPVSAQARKNAPTRLALQIAERRLLLLVMDAVALFVAGQGALIGWRILVRDMRLLEMLLSPYQGWVCGLVAIWLILIAVGNGYDLRTSARVGSSARCLAGVAVFFAVGYLTLFFLMGNRVDVGHSLLPLGSPSQLLRVVPVLFGVMALPLELGWRSLYALVLTGEHFQQRVLIVGGGRAGQTLAQALNETPGTGYQVVGFIDDDPAKLGMVMHSAPVMGNHLELLNIARQNGVNEIVLSISTALTSSVFESVMNCFEQGLHITPMPLLYEHLTGRVPVEHVGQQWYLSLPLSAAAPSRAFRMVERLLDVLVALVGLVVLALLCPLVALGNALGSPGPLFYWQARVGKGSRLFQVVKFRTMIPEAEKQSGAVWAKENDPRTTSFGRLLRKSRLDEAPQFWNVLKGDMSLVGPRPERPEFVDDLVTKIPFYRSRHVVRPGITGWAQVKYRYGSSVDDALIKLQYDLYYIKHRSLLLDLHILVKTIGVVLRMSGT